MSPIDTNQRVITPNHAAPAERRLQMANEDPLANQSSSGAFGSDSYVPSQTRSASAPVPVPVIVTAPSAPVEPPRGAVVAVQGAMIGFGLCVLGALFPPLAPLAIPAGVALFCGGMGIAMATDATTPPAPRPAVAITLPAPDSRSAPTAPSDFPPPVAPGPLPAAGPDTNLPDAPALQAAPAAPTPVVVAPTGTVLPGDQNRLVRQVFYQAMARYPNDVEAAYYRDRLARGATTAEVRNELLDSDEAILAQAYAAIVGRPIDDAGRATWLKRARDSGDVMQAVSELRAYMRLVNL